MRYMDGYYQHEISGWLLPTLDTWMVITNMRYLDGYYQYEIPGCFTNMKYLVGYYQHEIPGWL